MSASREKKQRQGAGVSEKATQAQNQKNAYQRKARTYTVIGIVVVVLVALLLVWNSGLFQSRATAATIGSEKISVAELGYYYYGNTVRQQYVYYGLLDSSKSDAEQMISETESFRDYFLESALSEAQNVTALYETAIKEGYKNSDVADQVKAAIDNVKAAAVSQGMSYKSYLKAAYGTYMTPAIFKNIATENLLASEYYSDKYDEVLNSYTAEDFQAYYDEHADDLDEITYSYLQFKGETVSSTDSDGNDLSEDEITKLEEEALAVAKADAEKALAAYKSGTSIADLIEEYAPYTSADHNTVQGVSSISANYSEELLKLGKDEAALVETESVGYYVVVFHSRERNETLSANVRHILFKADHTTAADGTVTAPTLKAMEEAKTEAEKALAEFESGAKTAEAFGELANKYSDDTGSNTNGGLYEKVTENYFVTELNDWMFGEEQPEQGATAVIAHEGDVEASNPYWGYHVIYLDSWDMAHWALDARDALTGETIESWMTELNEASFAAALGNGAKYLGN